MAFLTDDQLTQFNFKYLGKGVKISENASIYGASRIEVGDYTRIDDFCVLSAGEQGIFIGKYVHVACYCSLIGKERIELRDFSGISSRVAIYSSSDDYSGNFLTNPTVPVEFTNVHHAPIILGKHVIVGVGACILPGVTIGDGSAIGAFSLVTKSFGESILIGGVPAKPLKARKTNIFLLEKKVTGDGE